MRFWVDSGQVASYSSQVSRTGEHAGAAREYVAKNCEFGAADNSALGFFNQLAAPRGDLVPKVSGYLEIAERALAAGGKGLKEAADLLQAY
ncbi:hypothetical protein JOF53_004922 [Crossiella equi]|uniref:Uncharacterized protein n=1 Tax=Crossiella equi TaxID=130796 RepID=A0ABS5AK74_9PSEU|nr:hypothetical protein [Crossiella equi]MBP2476050.1 hypothetical protein [Crossiella equi]